LEFQFSGKNKKEKKPRVSHKKGKETPQKVKSQYLH
jgi:hypothetical protein